MTVGKKRYLVVIAILVILTMISGCFGNKKAGKKEKKVPEYTCNVEGVGKVKGAVASNVGIAIYGVEERDVIGGLFTSTQAQGKFVVVSVVVSNHQKDAITVDANSFKLVTNDGIEYSHSNDAMTAIIMSTGKTNAFLQEINPGITISAQIPFDIPRNKNISDLKLKATGGMMGDSVLLPLMVQLVGGAANTADTSQQSQPPTSAPANTGVTQNSGPLNGMDLSLGNITIGETTATLKAAMGAPGRIVTENGQVHWKYNDIDVIVYENRVSEIISSTSAASTPRGFHEGSRISDVWQTYGNNYRHETYGNLDLYEYPITSNDGIPCLLRFAVRQGENTVNYISMRKL